MSAIDQYMPCVCGSGKKFKFCKCGANQHGSEIDKILRLMEGDQELSALDRINSLLGKLPNAAWLYALKARVLLQLHERQAFVEVAHRFYKLKPDNPLALVYCSLAAGISGEPIQTQARLLLDGMAEGKDCPSDFVGHAIHTLCNRALAEDLAPVVGFWGKLQQKLAISYGQLPVQRSTDVHWYCKSLTRIVDPPDDAPFLERIDEVEALMRVFRYDQVEKKLQSTLRDYPNQPSLLSLLLNSQLAHLDINGALATAQKLAQHSSLDLDVRCEYQVLAWEYDQQSLCVQDFALLAEIESEDQLIEVVGTIPGIEVERNDDARHWAASMLGEEIPAKLVFNLLVSQPRDGYQVVSPCGSLAFFGRQTDKPPRVLMVVQGFPLFQDLKDKIVQQLKIQQHLEAPPSSFRCYTEFLSRNVVVIRDEPKWETLEETENRLVEEFLNFPFAVLDGLTPVLASERPELREKLKALVFHLEGSPRIAVRLSAYHEIYRRLNLDRPSRNIRLDPKERVLISDFSDALYLDFDQMPLETRIQLFTFADQHDMPCLELQLGRKLLDEPNLMKYKSAEMAVRISMTFVEVDPKVRLQHSERIVELCDQLDLPVGQAVMNHLAHLSQTGSQDDMRQYLFTAMQRFPNDPQLVAFMNRLLAQSNLASEKLSQDTDRYMVDASSTEPAMATTSSGLVLPGGDQSGNPTTSKLWLPGT